jgi:DNA-binding GntR family transcriptional regulator
MLVSRTSAPVKDQTLRNLRTAIIEGQFKPGERLVERELCQLTGVSRTCIREALRQLETEGLIKVIPNKGPVVASLSLQEAKEIYEIRCVLEALACKLFAERATSSEIANLTRSVQALEKAAKKEDPKGIINAKDQFYRIIFEGSGNTTIESLIRLLHARITRLRATSLSSAGRAEESIVEIRAILNAIKSRDASGAWEACVSHVVKAESVALRMLAKEEHTVGEEETGSKVTHAL